MMPETAANERRRKTHNSIYQHIYRSSGICTKQSLARDLGLSLPTIYQHLAELVEDGLVAYSGEQRSTGGRRAAGLSAVDGARFAVGASITEERIRFVAADLRLRELASRSIRHKLSERFTGYGDFLREELDAFLDANGLDRAKLLGVGITLPGIISADNSRIVYAPTLQLQNIALGELTASLPYPFYIENDAACGGYAEWFMRSGQKNMAYLSLENGVGGAVLLEGRAYGGDNRRSGEFGHMCVEPGGLKCSCGRLGCLEAYCSARRISDGLGITLEEFFAALAQGNREYEALWHDLLRHLAAGVNNIRMILDCEVVLGGLLAEYLEPWLPQLREYVRAGSPFGDDAGFLHLSVLRRHTVPLGGALLFIQEFLAQV